MMLALSLFVLLGAIVLVVAVGSLSWSNGPTPIPPRPPAPAVEVFDFCDHPIPNDTGPDVICGLPATHELAGSFGADGDHGRLETMAMISCYCPAHAPAGAVRVRSDYKRGLWDDVPFGFSGKVTSTGAYPDDDCSASGWPHR